MKSARKLSSKCINYIERIINVPTHVSRYIMKCNIYSVVIHKFTELVLYLCCSLSSSCILLDCFLFYSWFHFLSFEYHLPNSFFIFAVLCLPLLLDVFFFLICGSSIICSLNITPKYLGLVTCFKCFQLHVYCLVFLCGSHDLSFL